MTAGVDKETGHRELSSGTVITQIGFLRVRSVGAGLNGPFIPAAPCLATSHLTNTTPDGLTSTLKRLSG
ncbi:hypothetical protein E2C01_035661 [Portunus trituberculatus]|uniref:Uncharacterized protein n=1 Tax=Portunus trituberculatus TaxID=210409 RepID=A0A5B7FAC5_PORTR|nr:hypothetical protein [Portunus trituberculatus]